MEDNLLTLPQVRERLKVSYTTLGRYIKSGRMPIVRISRTKRYIKQEDLDKFIKENYGSYKPDSAKTYPPE